MTRRTQLARQDREITTHAGLWLDKFLGEDRGEDKAKQRLAKEVAGLRQPEEYQAFFTRWQEALAAQVMLPYVLKTGDAEVRGRMAVGLGAESVLETSIALHRTYGVPYIPGSALKGLASSFAHQRLGEEWKKGAEAHVTLFGNTQEAGFVTFFDALYKPGTGHPDERGNPQALWPDVITVHHPDYYRHGTKAPPADWDSPNPVSFLSATGRYWVALAGPDAWVTTAFQILKLALAEMGVGAKTSSGYGRLTLTMV